MAATDSSQSRNREVFDRFNEMTVNGELDHLEEVLDPEYTQVIPQCGELVRGVENVRGLERYGLEQGDVGGFRVRHVVESQPADLMVPGFGMPMPTFNLVRVRDEGETLTAYGTTTYPDGSEWYVVTLVAFRHHRILRQTSFFAPVFDAPGWRAPWVERLPMDTEE